MKFKMKEEERQRERKDQKCMIKYKEIIGKKQTYCIIMYILAAHMYD